MVMRSMRNSAKWMMLILGIAFVAWLVLEGVQEAGLGAGDPNPVVGQVGDRQIRYAEWNQYLQEQLSASREQREGSLTDEERRQITEAAWEQLTTDLLLQRELDRLGIRVTDEEIRHAFETSPPPDLMAHPAFQTDGQFDIQKYRDYFTSGAVDRQLLRQLEAWYRQTLPQQKLLTRISEGVFVSDAELWRHWRDTRETARVRYVSLDPAEVVADDEVTISDEEIERHYREHQQEFARPAEAVVHLASLPLLPSEADTAEARARAEEARASILEGAGSFEEVAEAYVEDDTEAGRTVVRSPRQLDPAVAEVAMALPVDQLSEPILGAAGFHLLQVQRRWAQDSVALRQLRVPVRLSRETEDRFFDRIDRLEAIALRSDLPTAADSLGVTVRRQAVLREGAEFVPGIGALGVAVDWAFDPENRPGDLSPFFEGPAAFHVVELLERRAPGARPLSEVAGQIREQLLLKRKKEEAARRLDEALAALEADQRLDRLAELHGWPVSESDAFRRVDFVPGLGQGTEAIGAAFGLSPGSRSGALDAGDRVAVVELLERQPPDRERFEEQIEMLRAQLTFQRRQEHIRDWVEALREHAEVRDMRDRVGRS